MKSLKRKEAKHWKFSKNPSNSGQIFILQIIDIGDKEAYVDLNRTFRIVLPKNVKENFGRNRVMDEFLIKFDQLKKELLERERQQEKNEDDKIFEPVWTEIESTLGVFYF